jgi:tetratricopeptide (TPR) repeat protein
MKNYARASTCIVFAGSIMLAFTAAWFTQPKARRAPVKALSTAPATPIPLLDRLPDADSNTLTGKAYAAALAKVRHTPTDAKNWVLTADALAQLQRETMLPEFYNHAELAYQESLRLSPSNVEALAGMASVSGGRHQFSQSIDWANQALAIDPSCVTAIGILGDAALELGDYEGAFTHYQKMMDLRPDLSSWSRAAHLLWLTGDRGKAIWLMEKAIQAGAPFAENTAWCRARMATMLFCDGALIAAEQAIQPVLQAHCSHPHVLFIAAKLAAAKQDFPAAKEFYHRLLESPQKQAALAGLGDLAAAQGDLKIADSYYQQVEVLHAEHAANGIHNHGFIAKFLADHDRNPAEALRMAEEHKLTKNVTEADTLAWVYLKNGQLPQAVTAIKIALSQNTPDPEIHYHTGMIAAAFGDSAAAKKHLNLALSMNPNFNLLHAPLAAAALAQLSKNPAPSETTAP